jgi:16S rRNA (cytosine1402-N4)-methyltransferase
LQIPHIPVLSKEIVNIFNDTKGTIIDCTVGYGGHSKALLKSNPNIKLICNDQDQEALDFSKERLSDYKHRIKFIKGRFSTILDKIDKLDDIRGILADIGVSSLQLDKASRGFGFESESLDMRMDNTQIFSAKDVVNHYSLLELERIFKDYGELREYKKLAKSIINQRKIKKFTSAKELSNFVSTLLPKTKLHPATLVFQAIRIEVNSELFEIKTLLDNIKNSTIDNAKIAIISFHSLEDRIVKQNFKKWSKNCICDNNIYKCECGNNNSLGKIITKKPILANTNEIKINPRARSSKLRVFGIDRLKEELL